MRRIGAIALLCVAVAQTTTLADTLTFSFADPIGDNTGLVDVYRMDLTFDDVTGDYSILLLATSGDPFQGDFRVNVNLFNPDTGTTARNPSFFQDVLNDFDYGSTTSTSLTLTGTNSRLTFWDEGDRVAASTVAGLGTPDGSSFFRSSVADLPFEPFGVSEDYIAADASGVASIVNAVPEPGSLVLCGIAVAGLWLLRRRSNR